MVSVDGFSIVNCIDVPSGLLLCFKNRSPRGGSRAVSKGERISCPCFETQRSSARTNSVCRLLLLHANRLFAPYEHAIKQTVFVGVVIEVGAMQGGPVVPQQHVALAPLVAVDELRARRVLEQLG